MKVILSKSHGAYVVHPLELGDRWIGVRVALEVDVAALLDVVRLMKKIIGISETIQLIDLVPGTLVEKRFVKIKKSRLKTFMLSQFKIPKSFVLWEKKSFSDLT